ncbi:MAG: hypothetical protein F4Z72_10305 [Gemmatimonadales bacterium]|nr:hypothetical protein [Candidatus Palauibacter irciniicola]MYC17878.1 hypothetical protein [Gemmatimonadales bacterium]
MRAIARSVAATARWSVPATIALWLGAAVLPAPVAAQEDFRAAELDRPTRIEDAHPIKFREWEFQSGLRGSLGEGDRGLLGLLEFKTGLFRNGQMGVEIEGGVERPSADRTGGGIEAASAHLLYGLARETVSLPAVAVRLDASTPGAGAIGHDDWQFGVMGIATRSLGRLRLHGNGGYRIAGEADGGDYWRFGLGADYPLGLFSRAILADLYVEAPVSAGRARVWAEIGTRFQVSNWSVLDFGLATRLDEWDEGNANVEIVIGVSRSFGIPGLTRVPLYPNPTIP